jgi:hypothetical protein
MLSASVAFLHADFIFTRQLFRHRHFIMANTSPRDLRLPQKNIKTTRLKLGYVEEGIWLEQTRIVSRLLGKHDGKADLDRIGGLWDVIGPTPRPYS